MSLIHYDRRGEANDPDWFKNWSSGSVVLPSYDFGSESGRVGKLLGGFGYSENSTNAILGHAWKSEDVFKVSSHGDAAPETIRVPHKEVTLESKLYDTLANFKIRTAQIAMHLASEFRQRLFRQLDSLLSKEDWVTEDQPPDLASFTTFLRLILFLKPTVQPGLGATVDGHIIGMWTIPHARLSIECLPNDQVRWVLSRCYENNLESAAGRCELTRIPSVLEPYDPEDWFGDADGLPAS